MGCGAGARRRKARVGADNYRVLRRGEIASAIKTASNRSSRGADGVAAGSLQVTDSTRFLPGSCVRREDAIQYAPSTTRAGSRRLAMYQTVTHDIEVSVT